MCLSERRNWGKVLSRPAVSWWQLLNCLHWIRRRTSAESALRGDFLRGSLWNHIVARCRGEPSNTGRQASLWGTAGLDPHREGLLDSRECAGDNLYLQSDWGVIVPGAGLQFVLLDGRAMSPGVGPQDTTLTRSDMVKENTVSRLLRTETKPWQFP